MPKTIKFLKIFSQNHQNHINFDDFSKILLKIRPISRFSDVLWALEEMADKAASREFEQFFMEPRFRVLFWKKLDFRRNVCDFDVEIAYFSKIFDDNLIF